MNPTMGGLETFVVNSPFRVPFARREVASFRRMAALARGLRVLEVGCGAGLTTNAIADMLKPSHLSAFDFSHEQVARAKRRLDKHAAVEIRQADATAMPYETASFDAVLEIGILHHIPRWREAILEVARVLRPGGTFCFAEPSRGRLTRGMYRIFPHPAEAMFEQSELLAELTAAGLLVGSVTRTLLWNIFGVAQKPARPSLDARRITT